MAETTPDQPFLEPAQIAITVDKDGPFPYRIVYLHTGIVQPGITLRWSGHVVPAAQSGAPVATTGSAVADEVPAEGLPPPAMYGLEPPQLLDTGRTGGDAHAQEAAGIYAFENIPAGRLFTDAKMERQKLLTGSIAGASLSARRNKLCEFPPQDITVVALQPPSKRCDVFVLMPATHAGMTLDVWSRGTSMATTRPMITRRLGSGFELSFALRDLYPDIAGSSIYSLQLRGYMGLNAKHVRVLHAKGQAVVHVAHCMLFATDASLGGTVKIGNATMPALAKGSTEVPAGLAQEDLHHVHIALTCAS